MIRIATVLVGLFVASASVANAQSTTSPFDSLSPPTVGGVGVRAPSEPAIIGASRGSEILRHRGPTGSPCLAVGGFARPHIVNPNLYDHVITVKNSCPQRLAMQVCYYNSQDCIRMEIPGGERTEAILGTLPAEKDFRFEFREKF